MIDKGQILRYHLLRIHFTETLIIRLRLAPSDSQRWRREQICLTASNIPHKARYGPIILNHHILQGFFPYCRCVLVEELGFNISAFSFIGRGQTVQGLA